jgi:hypothetical protein
MTDSTIALKDVENWIRSEFLSKKYHQAFEKRKLGVQSGGVVRQAHHDGGVVVIGDATQFLKMEQLNPPSATR